MTAVSPGPTSNEPVECLVVVITVVIKKIHGKRRQVPHIVQTKLTVVGELKKKSVKIVVTIAPRVSGIVGCQGLRLTVIAFCVETIHLKVLRYSIFTENLVCPNQYIQPK
jgi:hypothetical protein